MTKNLTTTEKVIGGIELIWGIFFLFITIYGATTAWSVASRHSDIITPVQAIVNIIKKHHNQTFLSILTIYSGAALLLSKKSGWTTSIATSLLNGICIIFNVVLINKGQNADIPILLFAACTSLAHLTIFLLLLSKPIKDKYATTSSTWPTVDLIVIVLLVDSLLFKI